VTLPLGAGEPRSIFGSSVTLAGALGSPAGQQFSTQAGLGSHWLQQVQEAGSLFTVVMVLGWI